MGIGNKQERITRYVADFETTTNENDCRVWGYGLNRIASNEFSFGKTIDDFFAEIFTGENKIIYFHNLKFDGEFILYYLLRNNYTHTKEKKLYNNEFNTLITDQGVFYSMQIKHNDVLITINDSLKIIPLSVEQIAKAFNQGELKGDIDYLLDRPIGWELTVEEIDYIRRDVQIVSRAIKTFLDQGMNRITQASNAFSDYKDGVTKRYFDKK